MKANQGAAGSGFIFAPHMTTRSKISLVVFVMLVLPLAAFLGYYFVYEPLKFHSLISRVESAKTPAEEREAFALAARRGRVWELNRLRPEELPESARHITGDWVLELEWLESSPWTGKPYRAYRRVLNTNSMGSLYVHYNK
jgi:hypothetical protein